MQRTLWSGYRSHSEIWPVDQEEFSEKEFKDDEASLWFLMMFERNFAKTWGNRNRLTTEECTEDYLETSGRLTMEEKTLWFKQRVIGEASMVDVKMMNNSIQYFNLFFDDTVKNPTYVYALQQFHSKLKMHQRRKSSVLWVFRYIWVWCRFRITKWQAPRARVDYITDLLSRNKYKTIRNGSISLTNQSNLKNVM